MWYTHTSIICARMGVKQIYTGPFRLRTATTVSLFTSICGSNASSSYTREWERGVPVCNHVRDRGMSEAPPPSSPSPGARFRFLLIFFRRVNGRRRGVSKTTFSPVYTVDACILLLLHVGGKFIGQERRANERRQKESRESQKQKKNNDDDDDKILYECSLR